MTVVLLIRHGLTDATGAKLTGWTPGFHLSDEGRAQAERMAERLADARIAAVYSSPLERCVETAEPLARRRRLEVVPREDLGEVRFGEWTGRSLRQLRRTKLWRAVQDLPSQVRFPGGESFLEVQRRAVEELGRIAGSHPSSTVAVVSHADVIKLVVAHFAGMHADLFQRLVVEPASLSVLLLGRGTPRVVKVNETGDLSWPLERNRPGRPSRKVRG